MKIDTAVLPRSSLLLAYLGQGDFLDCYACAARCDPSTAGEIAMGEMPLWARLLLKLRNVLVAPLGLKAGGDRDPQHMIGGIFPIVTCTETEMIVGFDDRHLDFRVSFLTSGERCHISTWVHTHSWFGRIYLATIMPFHILIIRNALARVSRACPA